MQRNLLGLTIIPDLRIIMVGDGVDEHWTLRAYLPEHLINYLQHGGGDPLTNDLRRDAR